MLTHPAEGRLRNSEDRLPRGGCPQGGLRGVF